ncbi:BlaI/MecI/CopY family transcriptional regulator [Fodinibius halophilus]|uniref:BlaI/MecI/CopY family transcriptional regulator n=1 Tax=Fodinibius halophilus TaxID=1736908 RepID=A0A6M1TE48_9BACT|nr:BlaI/MecI/CopY family transcriptional regulator [Fodinibius halophilus]NGP88472.1 BlaI/MecI/CopY family transcriptional regulator [Fodinibius halophilus]
MKLSKSEQQLMQYIWELEEAFLSELLEQYPEPKPASSTVATLLKRMKGKGYIDYEQMGRSRRYYPLVKKSDYFSKHINSLIKNYFNDSASTFASFFTKETDLSDEELEELQEIINNELKKRDQ